MIVWDRRVKLLASFLGGRCLKWTLMDHPRPQRNEAVPDRGGDWAVLHRVEPRGDHLPGKGWEEILHRPPRIAF